MDLVGEWDSSREVRKAPIMPNLLSPPSFCTVGFLGGFETHKRGLCLTQERLSAWAPRRSCIGSLPQVLWPHHQKLLCLPPALAMSAVTCFSYSCWGQNKLDLSSRGHAAHAHAGRPGTSKALPSCCRAWLAVRGRQHVGCSSRLSAERWI